VIYTMEVWERPWSPKARTQTVFTYVVEADHPVLATEAVRKTLSQWTRERLDQIIRVGTSPDLRDPVRCKYEPSRSRRPEAVPDDGLMGVA
jgi:hypothetical protein